MNLLKAYTKIFCIQLVVVTLLFVVITIIRFFDANNFKLIRDEYFKYAKFDTKTSYVYQGENS